MTTTVQKWGNSLGIRIPKPLAHTAHITEGTELEMTIERGLVVLRPVEVPSLQELLAQIKPGSKPELADWGKPVGKEAW